MPVVGADEASGLLAGPPAVAATPNRGDDATVRAIAATLALALLAACGGAGDQTGGGSTESVTSLDASAEQVLVAALAAPAAGDLRSQLVAELGRPDAFMISFESDAQGHAVRRETWSYLEQEAAVELVDGELLDVVPLDPLEGPALAATWYDPLAFTPETTVDDVRSMLADPTALVSSNAPAELGAALTAYAGDQLIVVFDAEGLVYAETIPLADGGAP
jgi:hypothetical protein